MNEIFSIRRVALPALTMRTITLALAGIVVLASIVTPGISSAVAVFTLQKAAKISLGNTTVATVSGVVPQESIVPATVMCPAKHQATGGGADSPALAASGSAWPWLIETAPVASGAKSVGWYVEVYNATTSGSVPFTAYAICAP